jgi:hypothetical protein
LSSLITDGAFRPVPLKSFDPSSTMISVRHFSVGSLEDMNATTASLLPS